MQAKNIPIVVLGGTGYVAGELTRLLLQHPGFDLRAVVSLSEAGEPVASKFPHLAPAARDLRFATADEGMENLRKGRTLGLFSALPHGEAACQLAHWITKAKEVGCDLRIVDLSSDFRFSDPKEYERIYGKEHPEPTLLPQFGCALPDLPNQDFGHFVAHPGCFTTSVVLAAYPLLANGLIEPTIVASCITGSTGAGRQPRPGTHHPERHGGLWAYEPLRHRHQPEMENLLAPANDVKPTVSFIPHSGPFSRGIHSSLICRIVKDTSEADVKEVISSFYAHTPFVKVVPHWPSVKEATGTNLCLLGIRKERDQIYIASVIDNLTKGAAGGGVQLMNELFAFEKSAGLLIPGVGWC